MKNPRNSLKRPGFKFLVSNINTVPTRLERETVRLSQAQMAALFGKERSVITKSS